MISPSKKSSNYICAMRVLVCGLFQTRSLPPSRQDANCQTDRWICLVELVQSHDIFDLAGESDVRSVLCSLLKCNVGVSVRVKNVRNVAILFDAMAQYHMINNNWQYVMGGGRFLNRIQKDGTEKYITSSCLSSSLSRVRRNSTMTASQYAICRSVEQMLRAE